MVTAGAADAADGSNAHSPLANGLSQVGMGNDAAGSSRSGCTAGSISESISAGNTAGDGAGQDAVGSLGASGASDTTAA